MEDEDGNMIIKEDVRIPDSNDLARLSNGTDGASTRYFEQLKRESKTPKVVPSRSASSAEGLREKYNY
jgi:hypothetical protein